MLFNSVKDNTNLHTAVILIYFFFNDTGEKKTYGSKKVCYTLKLIITCYVLE